MSGAEGECAGEGRLVAAIGQTRDETTPPAATTTDHSAAAHAHPDTADTRTPGAEWAAAAGVSVARETL